MKPLSGLDGMFLHLQTPDTPMHVGSMSLLDLPAGQRGDFFNAVVRLLRRKRPPAAPRHPARGRSLRRHTVAPAGTRVDLPRDKTRKPRSPARRRRDFQRGGPVGAALFRGCAHGALLAAVDRAARHRAEHHGRELRRGPRIRHHCREQRGARSTHDCGGALGSPQGAQAPNIQTSTNVVTRSTSPFSSTERARGVLTP